MARARRLTVRFADRELEAIRGFADEKHVIASVAVRRLIEVGLALENHARLPNGGRNRTAREQPTSPRSLG